MQVVDAMPNGNTFKADWEGIASKLQSGIVLKFDNGIDFPEGKATAFRVALGTQMIKREVQIKTRQLDGDLYVIIKMTKPEYQSIKLS